MSVISEIPKEALAADVKTPISAHGGCGGGPLLSRCRGTCRSLSSQTLDGGQYKKTVMTPRTWTDRASQPVYSIKIFFLDFDPSNKTHGHLSHSLLVHLLQREEHLTVENMQPQISMSALAALVPMVLALPQQQPPPPGPPAACAPVNIIVARGSLEAQGAGLLGNIAMNASMQIPGSVITPLVYPAQLDPYPPSVSAGVMNMTTLLNQQAQQCPQSKLVLMGYSQVRISRRPDVMALCLTCCRAHKCRWIPSAVPRMAPTSTRLLLRHPWSEVRVSLEICDAA